jgi:hypothetical protein
MKIPFYFLPSNKKLSLFKRNKFIENQHIKKTEVNHSGIIILSYFLVYDYFGANLANKFEILI